RVGCLIALTDDPAIYIWTRIKFACYDIETRYTAVSHLIPYKFDIAIIGGGILGSATAYFLLKESPTLSLGVIEPDPTYEFASTLRASGGCRVQFTCPENIAMSLYSIGFIKAFEQTMASNGRPAPVDWVEGG